MEAALGCFHVLGDVGPGNAETLAQRGAVHREADGMGECPPLGPGLQKEPFLFLFLILYEQMSFISALSPYRRP